MEECIPYKEFGGLIPPCPNDNAISLKTTKLVTKKWEISDQTKWPKFVYKNTKND